jgi:hypothetical protein
MENTWFEHSEKIQEIMNPERRAEAVLDHLPEPDSGESTLREEIGDWVRRHPNPHVHDIARRGFDTLAHQAGRKHWVTMGTSFVFYAEDVLAHIPNVKMIYLVRNPYDIVASSYRRVKRTIESENKLFYGDYLFSPLLGWSRGIRAAQSAKKKFSDQVHIVRYEDLVSDEEAVAEVFEFANVRFKTQFLEVPHVNKSDPAPSVEKGRGLNTSRVNYFPSVLNSGQMLAVSKLVSSNLIEKYYSRLEVASDPTTNSQIAAIGYQVQCALRLLTRLSREVIQSPEYAFSRIRHRVDILIS